MPSCAARTTPLEYISERISHRCSVATIGERASGRARHAPLWRAAYQNRYVMSRGTELIYPYLHRFMPQLTPSRHLMPYIWSFLIVLSKLLCQ